MISTRVNIFSRWHSHSNRSVKQHILDSILWAIKHVDRNIHEMGLVINRHSDVLALFGCCSLLCVTFFVVVVNLIAYLNMTRHRTCCWNFCARWLWSAGKGWMHFTKGFSLGFSRTNLQCVGCMCAYRAWNRYSVTTPFGTLIPQPSSEYKDNPCLAGSNRQAAQSGISKAMSDNSHASKSRHNWQGESARLFLDTSIHEHADEFFFKCVTKFPDSSANTPRISRQPQSYLPFLDEAISRTIQTVRSMRIHPKRQNPRLRGGFGMFSFLLCDIKKMTSPLLLHRICLHVVVQIIERKGDGFRASHNAR